MVGRYLKLLLLCSALIGCATPGGVGRSGECGIWSGLCTPAPANTTKPVATVLIPPLIVIKPDASGRTGAAVVPAPPAAVAASPASQQIALLLPLRSAFLAKAAAAVRDGFMAAHDREKAGIIVNVLEAGDNAPETLASYMAALVNNDVIVGPLTHSGVSAVAQSGAVSKPTIALNQPNPQTELASVLPPNMMNIGLSLEQEARQAASWAGAGKLISSAFVISTDSAWQRRAARAFAAQWQSMGLAAQSIELAAVGGRLDGGSLSQLQARLRDEQPALMLVALDADQTRQLRLAVGKKIMVYGTSLLNPMALADWQAGARAPELEQVRLLDLPWQLQADNAAVMAYPAMPLTAGQQRSADLERLYALGIDAYRIALKIASKNKQFEIDGVTGKLSVDFGSGPARFKRAEQMATYLNGVVVPLADQ